MKIGLILACLVSMTLPVTAGNSSAEQPRSLGTVDIGSRLELFVDDYLIESMDGASLKLHEPRLPEAYGSKSRTRTDNRYPGLSWRNLPSSSGTGSRHQSSGDVPGPPSRIP